MFSGAFCSGLIEAPLRLDRIVLGISRFPGLFAPASLKPRGHNQSPMERGAGFSGAFCSGLIEATLQEAWPAWRHCRFPGLFAPASLKLQEVDCVLGLVFRFPGLFAPASLKRLQGGDDPGQLVLFSGAFCSGLIEASVALGLKVSGATVFRGFLLRPH